MMLFRLLLSVLFVVIVAYTGIVITRHGLDFVPVFFGDIARAGWAGQFNVDFAALLLLAGLWVAWRHRFSAAGIALGCVALVGGTPFLCVYLLVQSARPGADARWLLLGPGR